MPIVLDFTQSDYVPLSGVALVLDYVDGSGSEDPPIPLPLLIKTHVTRYAGKQKRNVLASLSFASPKQKQAHGQISFNAIQRRDADSIARWRQPLMRSSLNQSQYQATTQQWRDINAWWQSPALRLHDYQLCWKSSTQIASVNALRWNNLRLRQIEQRFKYGASFRVDHEMRLLWRVPFAVGARTEHHRWGVRFVPPYCERDYIGATDWRDQLNFKNAPYSPPNGLSIGFDFVLNDQPIHCYEKKQSGFVHNDNSSAVTITPIRRPYDLEVYTMPVSIACKRIPDNTPINVLSVSASHDIDAFAWSFNLSLASEADYALISPHSGAAKEIEITINGHVFTAIIESGSRGQVFAKKTWSAAGRSRCAELTAPYAAATTGTVTNLKTAQQICLDILEFTGWALDWQIVDWTVPANSFTWADKTKLDQIATIVQAVGAVVNANPSTKILHVLSRYPVSSWELDTTTPDIALVANVIKSLQSQYTPHPPYNRVFVSGEHEGVLLQLTRTGTPGDQVSPMVVDRMLTAIEANRERGRVELSRAGKWSSEILDLPLATPPEEPAMIIAGTIVDVSDGVETWRGICTGVSIEARSGDNRTVNQKITVERFYE
jgi:hypothetical protein